jgi:hypothetical protein
MNLLNSRSPGFDMREICMEKVRWYEAVHKGLVDCVYEHLFCGRKFGIHNFL